MPKRRSLDHEVNMFTKVGCFDFFFVSLKLTVYIIRCLVDSLRVCVCV